MKRIGALAISVWILAAQTSQPALRSVTAVRHWAMPSATRVAIEISGDFEYRTDRLHNPERVYFDILNSRPRLEGRRFFKETIEDDRLLTGLRVAETNPGVTRIVLDLTAAVEVTTSQLANPDRLMIELRAGAAPVIPTGTTPSETLPRPGGITTAARPDMPPARPVPAAPPPAAKYAEPAPAPKDIDVGSAVSHETTAPAAAAAKTTLPAETSKAARHTSTGDTSLVRALGLKIGRVVIDPGHGGHDEGTTGPKGLLEKDVVLDIALRVGKLIEERMGAEVIYTRSDDTFVPLEGRTALANEKKADLFLSIHLNSSSVPRISGVETYFLNLPDSRDKGAGDVAARENATSQKSIFELRDLLQQITLHNKLEESREFASRVQSSLYAFSARNFPGEKNRGVKKAPFVVLIGANMPSILAEVGFLSNPREEALLGKPEYCQKLAEALFRGVSRYADSLSHFQVAKAGAD